LATPVIVQRHANLRKALLSKKRKVSRLQAAIEEMVMGKLEQSRGFVGLLLGDDDFTESMKSAVYTSHAAWFDKLLELDEHDEIKFNTSCDMILSILYRMVHDAAKARNKQVINSYHYQVYHLIVQRDGLGGNDWKAIEELLPTTLLFDKLPVCLIILHFSDLVLTWMRASILSLYKTQPARQDEQLATTTSGRPKDEDLKKLVNRFLGWAVFSLTRNWEKDYGENEAKIAVLESMHVYEHEAVLDSEYMENCYAMADQLRNRGGLCLISKQFFDFGREFMTAITNLNVKSFELEGNDAIEDAFNDILNSTYLSGIFIRECRRTFEETDIGDHDLLFIYQELFRKAFHAWAGTQSGKYKEENTGRQAAGSTKNVTFRDHLNVATSRTSTSNNG
jgi:hypothetical protein